MLFLCGSCGKKLPVVEVTGSAVVICRRCFNASTIDSTKAIKKDKPAVTLQS